MTITRPLALAALAAVLTLGGVRPRLAAAEDPAPPAAPPAPPVAAPPAAPPGTITFTTERAVVFKDGFALFVDRGTGVADAQGRLSTTAPVMDGAVLGCVWASTDDRPVVGLRAEWVESREIRFRRRPCLSVPELLYANQGKQVTVVTAHDKATVTGTILGVASTTGRFEDPPGPGSPRRTGPAGTSVREVPFSTGTFVTLEVTERGSTSQLVLPVSSVLTVQGVGLERSYETPEEVTTRAKRLTVDLGPAAAGKPQKVRLLYFAEGLRWIPTYRIGGGLATNAEVSLQAEVLNESHDLVDASLDLVVGVPSFRFKDVASPLSLERALRGVLQQAAPQLAQQAMLRTSNSFSNEEADIGVAEGDAGALRTAPELATEAQQDLFVYGVGKTSLPRGVRASFPLWQTTAALRHVYTLDVQVVRNWRSGEWSWRSTKSTYQPSSVRPDRARRASVWHEVELENASRVPWTTGAALLIKDDVPLGQDILLYTSAGAKTLLPVTVAVDVQGTWSEEEIERRADARSWSGATYGLVRKKGTVTLVNRRKEASTVRVSVSVGGKADVPSDGGRVVTNDLRSDDWSEGAYAINNHSDISWEVTLAPGETKVLAVDFEFYVR